MAIMKKKQLFCQYYQARVRKEMAWFVVGGFRNEGNIAFVRAVDGSSDLLEFFVPEDCVDEFLHVVRYMQERGYFLTFEQLDNRLQQETTSIQQTL